MKRHLSRTRCRAAARAVASHGRKATASAAGRSLPLRLQYRRDRLRSGASVGHLFAHDQPQHLRRAADLRLPRASGQAQAQRGVPRCRKCRTITVRSPSGCKPGIYFQDDPVFKGVTSVNWWRRTSSTRGSASSIRAGSRRLYPSLAPSEILGTEELRTGSAEKPAVSTTTEEIEGLRALDRYTFQVRIGKSDPALHLQLHRPVDSRRDRARSSRVLRQGHHGAPGRHRAISPRRMEALVQTSYLSATRPTARTSSMPSLRPMTLARQAILQAIEGAQAADGRPRRGRRHRRKSAALAVVSERSVRHARGRSARVRADRNSERAARAQPCAKPASRSTASRWSIS